MLCVMALFAISAQAQTGNPQLDKLFRVLFTQQRGTHVQKAATDSLLTSYAIHEANQERDYFTQSLYEYQENASYLHTSTDYQYLVNGRLMESGTLDDHGDTLAKTVYSYDDSAKIMQMETYVYEEQDAALANRTVFYGVKDIAVNVDISVGSFIDGLNFCDSMLMVMYEMDTMEIKGVYAYDSLSKYPKGLTINTEYFFIEVAIMIDFTYTDTLLTAVKASMLMSAFPGPMDVMTYAFTYNEKGQVLESEMTLLPNDYNVDLESLVGGSNKTVYTYRNDKTHSISYYSYDNSDTVNGPKYELDTREYYTYQANGDVDTVYTYSFGELGAGVGDIATLNVRISPNPVKDMLYVSGLEAETEVGIYSAEGKKLMQTRVQEGESSISTQELPKGVYFIRLQNQYGNSVKQVVKQ